MTVLVRCNKADDPRCPRERGPNGCDRFDPHEHEDACDQAGPCAYNDDLQLLRVRCVKVKEEDKR
jgi:hypothetical protein